MKPPPSSPKNLSKIQGKTSELCSYFCIKSQRLPLDFYSPPESKFA